MNELCIWTRRPGRRIVRIIVILVIGVAVTRWAPEAALPLITGVALGGWLTADVPVMAVV